MTFRFCWWTGRKSKTEGLLRLPGLAIVAGDPDMAGEIFYHHVAGAGDGNADNRRACDVFGTAVRDALPMLAVIGGMRESPLRVAGPQLLAECSNREAGNAARLYVY